jgi:hypothetical protein
MRSDALGLFWEDMPVIKESKAKIVQKRSPPERTWERPGYLPGLEDALRFNVPLMSDDEILEYRLKGTLAGVNTKFVYDIECYPNYFLIAFKDLETGKVVYFERIVIDGVERVFFDHRKLGWLMQNFCHVSFNGIGYDAPIAALALAGCSCEQLWEATKKLIVEQMRPADVLKMFKAKKLHFDHIDLIEVAPLRASLKIYGGRLHTKRMQDLPFPPGTVLNMDQIAIVRWYCCNDLQNTGDLYGALIEQVDLRVSMSHEYGIDLRSKSDAQIAEAVLGHEIEALNGYRLTRPQIDPGTVYRYNVPGFLRYSTPLMNWVLATVAASAFVVADHGSIDMPPQLAELKIAIGGSVYQMGIGGLHSTEKSAMHVEDEYNILKDVDVESFYPRIILNQGLYPKHLGVNFLAVYNSIVERRIAAKRSGDKVTADSLKITINGSFGKLGSKYSILYAPDLLIQTTISGQLSLLMLIERLELCGIPVVSANTDGIVIKCPRDKQELCNYVVGIWEIDCQYKTEETRYAALYSRDVNNYVAVKKGYDKKNKVWLDEVDGAKTKGAFAKSGLQKNPTNYVCVEAVVNLLTVRKPVYETIWECKDITKFVSVRSVSGGAVKDGEFLGKSIRWYYAKGVEGEIIYAKNGNKVPKSDGAKPLMQLPDVFPDDVDYNWYIRETEKMLSTLGYAI